MHDKIVEDLGVKIGILKEEKAPPDYRVPLTPKQCGHLMRQYEAMEIFVQSSPIRCYSDEEYTAADIPVVDDISGCDILFGVKEIPGSKLIPGKTYFFFSHTIKRQAYNREMLQDILQKNIRLIDYECLVDRNGQRIIAFGRWAGIVGTHNGLQAYGKRTGTLELPDVHKLHNYAELKAIYNHITLPKCKIVLAGGGKVASGAIEVLEYLNVKRISPELFLEEDLDMPVYTQLLSHDMYQRPDGAFELEEFYSHPERYESTFLPYAKVADIMINGIFWNPRAPAFFNREQMTSPDFRIRTIADITCDIEGSIPATLRPTTVDNPVYGYDPQKGSETQAYQNHVIDIMAVDNLPNELPRDASEDFGTMLIGRIFPELMKRNSAMIEAATITKNGRLTPNFAYLRDFVEGHQA